MEKPQKGFTLIELLIAIAILILLLMFVFINLRGQSAKATDIKRKTDLYNLSKSFEDYMNDEGVFPPQEFISNSNCNSPVLVPYIAKIPCDPVSKQAYGYFPTATGGYRLCAKLSDTTDPAIVTMGCGGPLGCGLGGGYNYCLAAGVTASAVPAPMPTSTPMPTPTPISSPPPGQYACAPADFLGTSYCKSYADPVGFGCPRTYQDPHCNNECQTNPAIRCQQ
ncbi:MAG: prepilin-type N-terminal cleavage/methylation domain-containing protein [Candidatus Gottesmanbacteria bacterium]|nr:prepilin-type N-terminal cleavage/methylation domain-containing protein [Candidatus Gottesmanbacteria bacterium]